MPQALPAYHATDPKDDIWAEVRPYLDGIRVLGARILVGVYVRPEKTKSGLLLTARTLDEDRYQGKCGLLLAKGSLAFQDDATHRFGAVTPQVGDWVVFRVGDTFPFELGERRCRCVEDVDVQMIIDRPDSVW